MHSEKWQYQEVNQVLTIDIHIAHTYILYTCIGRVPPLYTGLGFHRLTLRLVSAMKQVSDAQF